MSNSATTSIIDFLRLRLNRRSVAFFLCLILSGLFWLLTSLSKEYIDEIQIPVTYLRLPENLLVVNEPTDIVSAQVKGFGFDLLWHWFNFEKLQIEVVANPSELTSTTKGGDEVHYILTEQKTGKLSDLGDKQLEILKISPDTLFLKFKPLYSKSIPVKLDAEVSYLKQYGLDGEPIVDPSVIEVSGLKEMVSEIEVVLTEKQLWTDLDESISEEVVLINEYDSRLVRYSQEKVQVAINVVEYTEGSVVIPITVKAGNRSVKVYPNEVELKYQVPLSDYDQITSEMFEVEVVLDAESEKRNMLTVNLVKSPSLVRQVRFTPVQVEYIVQQ